MKMEKGWLNVLARNGLALFALMLVHYIPDRFFWKERSSFDRFVPYLFLLTMFGWIVFHNRILFGKLYLKGKKKAYFTWTLFIMLFSSINMHIILRFVFHQTDTLTKILGFWIFTVTGLGVYVIFLYLRTVNARNQVQNNLSTINETRATHINVVVDGMEKQIPLHEVLYVESMENYVKLFTSDKKMHLVRISLKEAEFKLSKPGFLRISRSHIINTSYVEGFDQNNIQISGKLFKIGKVYKRYVEEQLNSINPTLNQIGKFQA